VSEQPSLALRTEAVRVWDLGASHDAETMIRAAESLTRRFKEYEGMVSVDQFVQAGLADLGEALGYLRRARATIAPIVDRRLDEERKREQ